MSFPRAIRLLGFLALPTLGMLAPFLVLPTVSSIFGAAGWSAIAVGQSVGAAAAVLVELGWGLNGPQAIARMDADSRRREFALALTTRSLLFAPLALLVFGASQFASDGDALAAGLSAVAAAALGLSASWFFIGADKPLVLFAFDQAPRLLVAVVAVVVLRAGAPLWSYPALALVGSALSLLLSVFAARVSFDHFRGLRIAAIWAAAMRQRVMLRGRAVSALYIALPVTIMGLVAPDAVPGFAAVERLMRAALGVVVGLPNALQSWVGRAGHSHERASRVKSAIVVNSAAGLCVGLTFVLVAPLAIGMLFSGVVTVSAWSLALAGLVIALTCTSRATGSLGLVAFDGFMAISRSATLGAMVGIPGIAFGGLALGAPGGFLGEAIAESVVLAVQARSLRFAALGRAGRDQRASPPAARSMRRRWLSRLR